MASTPITQSGIFPIVAAPASTPSPSPNAQPDAGTTPLFGLEAAQLAEVAARFGGARYRAQQLEHALYRQWVGSIEEMSTLPKAFRDELQAAGYSIGLPSIEQTFTSIDGTERYLIAGLDGQTVETVWMPGGDGAETTPEARETLPGSEADPEAQADTSRPDAQADTSRPGAQADTSRPGAQADTARPDARPDTRGTPTPQRRATICVSSQIGCAVNCQFCLTAKLGILRNLTPGEIAGQVVAVLKRQGVHLGRDRINLVFMGMGEPFLNYDAFIAAFRLLTGPIQLQSSRMTVSTSGIVPGIERFAKEPSRPRLAISLNASNDTVRESIMPVTRKWNTQAVLDAVRTIPLGPREKITFEYVLLGGVNDQIEHADEVVALVKTAGFPAYVNLIVWNPGPGTPYNQPDPLAVDAFQKRLIARGVTAYIRRPRGRDIYAACGQLKNTTS